MPNTNERYLKGNNRGYGAESLPNISGGGVWIHQSGTGFGAFYSETGNINQNVSGAGGEAFNKVYFEASRSSSTYQYGAKVNPDHMYVNFIVRY